MFEELSRYLSNRDYGAAGAILSSLGSLTQPKPENAPEGFTGASVLPVDMADVFHIFIEVSDKGVFHQLPGDMLSARQHDNGARLLSKVVHLSDLYAPDCNKPVSLHFLYAYNDEGTLDA
jgi:hypothetical protein